MFPLVWIPKTGAACLFHSFRHCGAWKKPQMLLWNIYGCNSFKYAWLACYNPLFRALYFPIALHNRDSPADLIRRPSRKQFRCCSPLRQRSLSRIPDILIHKNPVLMSIAPLSCRSFDRCNMNLLALEYSHRSQMSRLSDTFVHFAKVFLFGRSFLR